MVSINAATWPVFHSSNMDKWQSRLPTYTEALRPLTLAVASSTARQGASRLASGFDDGLKSTPVGERMNVISIRQHWIPPANCYYNQ